MGKNKHKPARHDDQAELLRDHVRLGHKCGTCAHFLVLSNTVVGPMGVCTNPAGDHLSHVVMAPHVCVQYWELTQSRDPVATPAPAKPAERDGVAADNPDDEDEQPVRRQKPEQQGRTFYT